VDDSPAAPNEKERTWAVLQDLMPVMQGAGMGLEDWADVIEYSPLPSSFAEKLRAKALEQKNNPQPDPAQQMAQVEMQKTMSEAQENEAQAQWYQVRAQKEAATPIQPPAQPGMNTPRFGA
jgi:hypothetical protein